LKLALLENKEGYFVKPTSEAATAALAGVNLPENLRLFIPDPSGAESYPIVTYSWVLLYKTYPDLQKAKALQDLFRWCLLEGQTEAAGLGYVPLPPNVTGKALRVLDAIGLEGKR
jgi:phosphate transport system substrate-binding protein